MAGSDLPPPRGGPPPSNPPLRQSVLHRSTPGRVEGRGDASRTCDGSAGAVETSLGKEVVADQARSSRFEPGGSSNQGGRTGEWRDQGFNGQGFGGYEEGYFEGNNGYGNGYGSSNRGNFRPRPYNNYRQQWNRGYNNNFCGGTNRFNAGGNRYQRHFNTNETPPNDPRAQVLNANQQVISPSGNAEASPSTLNMETSSVENLANPLSSTTQKKIDKMQCLRCGENGHFADTCIAALCLYCEKTSHESQSCPLLSVPKPVAIMYGVSRNELMFHEVPASSEVTFKHDNGKLGKISITGGRLESHEIVKELEWIIPDMVFSRSHPVVQMKVEVTRVEFIPTTTVDHTYDGQGYGLIFKLGDGQVKGKDDVDMDDANSDDASKNGEDKNKEGNWIVHLSSPMWSAGLTAKLFMWYLGGFGVIVRLMRRTAFPRHCHV
ncbi:hypothetical protein ACQ4PT_067114 [Festuca glaucescens]